MVRLYSQFCLHSVSAHLVHFLKILYGERLVRQGCVLSSSLVKAVSHGALLDWKHAMCGKKKVLLCIFDISSLRCWKTI